MLLSYLSPAKRPTLSQQRPKDKDCRNRIISSVKKSLGGQRGRGFKSAAYTFLNSAKSIDVELVARPVQGEKVMPVKALSTYLKSTAEHSLKAGSLEEMRTVSVQEGEAQKKAHHVRLVFQEWCFSSQRVPYFSFTDLQSSQLSYRLHPTPEEEKLYATQNRPISENGQTSSTLQVEGTSITLLPKHEISIIWQVGLGKSEKFARFQEVGSVPGEGNSRANQYETQPLRCGHTFNIGEK